MDLAAGQMVTPNVRLVQLLGEGGMGSVWVAHHRSLNTQVAVKFVSKELLEQDGSSLARFNREAALSAQIKSPHVVQIFDHGVAEAGMPFIVMELLEGETLAERIDQKGALGLADTRIVITQTAKALAKAHQLGIVHRDIKPDNIFLVEPEFDLYIKVLDFGIAKQTRVPATSALTQTGAMVGTPEFMSPEQALSAKSVDHRSDLWALGVVAYYSLTGSVPFSGETLGSLCVAIAAGEFTPVTRLKPGLPPGLDSWFDRALANDVDERFSSARELAVGFAEALGPLGAPAIEDQFSQVGDSGPMLDWMTDDSSVASEGLPSLDSYPPSGGKGTASEAPTVSVNAKTVASRGTPTFSGASMAAGEPRRRVSKVALWALVAAALAAGVVAGVHYTQVPLTPSRDGSPATTSEPAPSSTASADDRTLLAAQDDEWLELDSGVGAGGAEPVSDAEPTATPAASIRRPVRKPVAAAALPRKSSTVAPSQPHDDGSAHASAPLPELPPDRGF